VFKLLSTNEKTFFLTLIVSSSSASVVVSPAAAMVGRLTIFVSRLSRDEKKKELLPDASKMPENNQSLIL
jgi:hypothetical protein